MVHYKDSASTFVVYFASFACGWYLGENQTYIWLNNQLNWKLIRLQYYHQHCALTPLTLLQASKTKIYRSTPEAR